MPSVRSATLEQSSRRLVVYALATRAIFRAGAATATLSDDQSRHVGARAPPSARATSRTTPATGPRSSTAATRGATSKRSG
jgi:hypothetical protein